jgi:hypothetical protein
MAAPDDTQTTLNAIARQCGRIADTLITVSTTMCHMQQEKLRIQMEQDQQLLRRLDVTVVTAVATLTVFAGFVWWRVRTSAPAEQPDQRDVRPVQLDKPPDPAE